MDNQVDINGEITKKGITENSTTTDDDIKQNNSSSRDEDLKSNKLPSQIFIINHEEEASRKNESEVQMGNSSSVPMSPSNIIVSIPKDIPNKNTKSNSIRPSSNDFEDKSDHQQEIEVQQQQQQQQQQQMNDIEDPILIPALLIGNPKYEEEFAWEYDPYAGSPESKYKRYELPVSHEEGDRAMSIKLCSIKRPHMRSFHVAWISFFLAFVIWFAPAPLLKEIGTTLNLTKQELWNSSIANDITAITMRIIIGPIVDRYGARIPMAMALAAAAIPCSMVGLVNTAAGLSIVRFFIGIAGSTFVMAQFWPSRMFAREISGTANGTVAGWGNFGGAFTQLLIGRILFPFFKNNVYDGNAEKAWRIVCVFPASVAFIWGSLFVWRISDDAPVGNYHEMRRNGTMDRVYFTTSFRSTLKINTIVLYVQYACCFGVEIVMNNGAVLYFIDQFGLSTEDASTLAFTYGSMNLIFRGLGGYLSDTLNLRYGLRGRLWIQAILLFLEGVMIIAFSYARTLPGAIVTMIIFSIFTQAAEGAIFGVVPYISKLYTGSVSGIVGSGGNVGSVVYGFLFRGLPYRQAFLLMGSLVIASSFLTICLKIPCHASMLWGEDHFSVINVRKKFMSQRDLTNIEHAAEEYGPHDNDNDDENIPINQETTVTDDDNNNENITPSEDTNESPSAAGNSCSVTNYQANSSDVNSDRDNTTASTSMVGIKNE